MAGFVKGDVVVFPFPFSDLSQSKRRPALVVAEAGLIADHNGKHDGQGKPATHLLQTR